MQFALAGGRKGRPTLRQVAVDASKTYFDTNRSHSPLEVSGSHQEAARIDVVVRLRRKQG